METTMLRCFAAGLIFLTGIACAQTFPAKPISLVVPFTTGAANDTLARTLGAEMRDSLGAVLVGNYSGPQSAGHMLFRPMTHHPTREVERMALAGRARDRTHVRWWC